MGSPEETVSAVILSLDPERPADLAAHLGASRLSRFDLVIVEAVEELLAAVSESKAGLVIVDTQLPPDDCLQAVELLSESAPHVAMVWMVGEDDQIPIETLPASEAVDFLVWPSVLPADHLVLQSLRRHRMRARLQERRAELRTLVYGITHDLRAPLLTLDYLIDDAESAIQEIDAGRTTRLHDLLGRSRRVLDQMSMFVEQIVRVAEITSAAPKDEPLELDELVATLRDDMGGLAERRQVHIDVGALDATILADRTRFYHLLQNLLHNAIQHTPRGTHVTIMGQDLEPDDPGGPLRIAVIDGGPGFAGQVSSGATVQDLIASGAARPGHGLGLRLAVLAAAHHNATVRVEPHPEQGGAMFYFDLPAGRVVKRPNGNAAHAL